MRLGEVGLLTNDVVRLSDFYKALLETDNGSKDKVHQTIIGDETMLTVYNDGSVKNNGNQNICLAFTVDDVEREYQRVLALGAEVIEKPTRRPWGAVNMSFYDPDRNVIYLRSFSADSETMG
ncbi:MAG: VOC family protein [Oscillospiraceae bacterium]|nr:VOC family protein [Oscillospiraceae bacterium]